MRAVLIRSLLVVGLGAVILAGVLYVASTVDTRPPEVLEVALTQPVGDESDVAYVTTSIEVSFSEPVDPDSAADAVRLDPPADGGASWSGSTLIFTPTEPLELTTEYAVTIATGIRDLAGNEMTEAPSPFVFATTDRPSLASSEPVDGATDVAVDAVVSLVFSGLMDTASVEEALEVEPAFDHDLRWSGERLDVVPAEPLEAGTEYVVRVGAGATDVAGVAIGEPLAVGFRTVAAGLGVEATTPADGADGISPRTPIAVVLDRAVDPESVDDDLLAVSPSVPGTLELVAVPGEEEARMIRFSPSSSLRPSTTVEVTLDAGLRAMDGGSLAEPVTWSFTTGAPQTTLSNRVVFLSDRSGVTNVWAMNPDGTGQHQVSAELAPILDYAVAPNGSSLVVADGRRLVFLRADGSERRVLTDAAHLEFDPAYAPDGSRIAFARADAATGQGLGLWTWEPGAGAAERIDLPSPSVGGFVPSPDPRGDSRLPLRAPRFSPDGGAIAFVDGRGAVGILERPGQRMVFAEGAAAGPPVWDAGSSALFVPLADDGAAAQDVTAPVGRLDPGGPVEMGIFRRSGTAIEDAELGDEALRLTVAPDGRIGWIAADGSAHLATELYSTGDVPETLEEVSVRELVLGPPEDVVLVVGTDGRVRRVELDGGDRSVLAPDGRLVRWLP